MINLGYRNGRKAAARQLTTLTFSPPRLRTYPATPLMIMRRLVVTFPGVMKEMTGSQSLVLRAMSRGTPLGCLIVPPLRQVRRGW